MARGDDKKRHAWWCDPDDVVVWGFKHIDGVETQLPIVVVSKCDLARFIEIANEQRVIMTLRTLAGTPLEM